MQNSNRSFRLVFLITLFALFTVLIVKYLWNRSVWNDEAYLALTVTNMSAKELFFPLPYFQASPILFLLIEKLSTVLFGGSEYALRLFPLLTGLAAIPLFYFLCLRFTGDRIFSLSAMILLGLTPGFLYYSSEIKQYCSDLFVALLLLNVAFNNASFLIKKRTWWLCVAGVIAVFLSNVSIIILFTIGLYFLYITWKTKKIHRAHWIPALVWVIAFGANFLLFIKDHPHTEYMKDFWQFAFMPLDMLSPEFRLFTHRSGPMVFDKLLPSIPVAHLYVITIILFLSGILAMFLQKKFLLLYLCIAPLLIHLGLSVAKIYPFELRLLLYHAPLYILTITFGLFWMINKLPVDPRTRIIIIVILLALPSIKTFRHYFAEHDEIKNAITYINAEHKPGESMYVSTGAVPGIKYYRQREVAKFDDLAVSYGKETILDSRNFLDNINTTHGHLWFVYSEVFPIRGNKEEEAAIANALQQRGKLISQKRFIGSTVYLYNMP
jgi:4-amino-4-deoxy-L-arabinose transferase-like glycosyltransferase